MENQSKGQVLAIEIAESELEKWHDFRKVRPNNRMNIDEDLKRDVMRDKLIEGFMFGDLIFDPKTGILKQKLQFPVTKESGDIVLSELNWRPRFHERDLTEPMKGIKSNDNSGRMKAYMSAITGANSQHLGSMDYADYSLSQTIVNYFLL